VQVFEGGEPVVDTLEGTNPHPDQQAIVAEARAYLLDGDTALIDRLGFRGAREEVLINGVTRASLVGKVLVTSINAGFNTYDRELLAGFSGFVRQRVVDFNKEWRTLARSFRPEHVARLLHHPDYVKRHLTPREAEVAILYVDISGFTALSERVLRSPAAVAELVEVWSRESVNIVWKHGGVFDKMVGDCVIGLFGPPFYDDGPAERLAAAIRCAVEIRAMTHGLPEKPGFEHLKDAGFGVSTGVNLAPLFVGQFGPNDNFTGFSSGMNNTARLQGCACKDEILVMEDAAARLEGSSDFRFGAERSAKVKNVADPLRFRALE
jgi:adenylate cyclase